MITDKGSKVVTTEVPSVSLNDATSKNSEIQTTVSSTGFDDFGFEFSGTQNGKRYGPESLSLERRESYLGLIEAARQNISDFLDSGVERNETTLNLAKTVARFLGSSEDLNSRTRAECGANLLHASAEGPELTREEVIKSAARAHVATELAAAYFAVNRDDRDAARFLQYNAKELRRLINIGLDDADDKTSTAMEAATRQAVKDFVQAVGSSTFTSRHLDEEAAHASGFLKKGLDLAQRNAQEMIAYGVEINNVAARLNKEPLTLPEITVG